MTTEKTQKVAKKTNGTGKRIKMPPAYDLSNEHDGSDDLFQQVIKSTRSRSELTQYLDTIQEGRCKVIGGDASRILSIQTAANNFGKRVGRKFIVKASGDNGSIVIARLRDPVSHEVEPENEPEQEEVFN